MDQPLICFRCLLGILVQLWDDTTLSGLFRTKPEIPNTLHSLGETLARQANYPDLWEEIKQARQSSSLEQTTKEGRTLLDGAPPPSPTELEALLSGNWPTGHLLSGSLFEPPARLFTEEKMCTLGFRQKAIRALVICTHLHNRYQQPVLMATA